MGAAGMLRDGRPGRSAAPHMLSRTCAARSSDQRSPAAACRAYLAQLVAAVAAGSRRSPSPSARVPRSARPRRSACSPGRAVASGVGQAKGDTSSSRAASAVLCTAAVIALASCEPPATAAKRQAANRRAAPTRFDRNAEDLGRGLGEDGVGARPHLGRSTAPRPGPSATAPAPSPRPERRRPDACRPPCPSRSAPPVAHRSRLDRFRPAQPKASPACS